MSNLNNQTFNDNMNDYKDIKDIRHIKKSGGKKTPKVYKPDFKKPVRQASKSRTSEKFGNSSKALTPLLNKMKHSKKNISTDVCNNLFSNHTINNSMNKSREGNNIENKDSIGESSPMINDA